MKFPVISVEGDQFLMATSLNDSSFVKDADFVCIPDGRKPVGYHDCSP